MTDVLTSLTRRPEELLSEALSTLITPASGVSTDDLVVAYPGGGKAIVTPAISTLGKNNWCYYGHAVVKFDQADLGEVFGDYEIRLKVSGPVRSGELANQLGMIFGVNLQASDVVDFRITTITPGMAVVLKANPSSSMWKGQRTVKLYTRISTEAT